MVIKFFIKRRLRTSIVFTGVGMIFVLLFLIFFKDEGISKNVERSRKLSLKNQNVVNLKEISNNMDEPLRTNPSKNNVNGDESNEEEEENIENSISEDKNENKNENENENENENKNEDDNKEDENEDEDEDENETIEYNKMKMLKNKKPIPVLPELKLDDFSTKDFFKLYHRGNNYRDGDDPNGIECPVPWTWTDNKEESDIIVLNVLDNLGDLLRIENFQYDKTRQKLLLMSMESTSNYDVMVKKKNYFNYMIDYRLDSDVPIPYTYGFFDFSKQPVPTQYKGLGGRGIAAVFISNCNANNNRLEFLDELMQYTRVDSFGMCSHNKEVYFEDSDMNSWNTKMNTIRKYKFTLAFENSNDRDYVTEKFFQPLEVGSVPVFLGTSNIADFAPPHSYIDARDFENAKELAEYLEYLDKHDDEYEEYLAWKKTEDFGDNLNHLIEIRKYNSICQLLQRIKGYWVNPYLAEWDRHDVPENERACGLC